MKELSLGSITVSGWLDINDEAEIEVSNGDYTSSSEWIGRKGESVKSLKLKEPVSKPPKPSDTVYAIGVLESKHGWLAPDGIFYPCKYGDHEWFSTNEHLPTVRFVPEKSRSYDTDGQLLQRCGWIQVTKCRFNHPRHLSIDDDFPVPKEQFKTINDYLSLHNEEDILHYCFRVNN